MVKIPIRCNAETEIPKKTFISTDYSVVRPGNFAKWLGKKE